MKADNSWHPMPGIGQDHIYLNPEQGEFINKWDSGRIAAVVFWIVIVAAVSYLLGSHPGFVQLAQSLVTAIWDMFCDMAKACRDFFEFIRRQASN